MATVDRDPKMGPARAVEPSEGGTLPSNPLEAINKFREDAMKAVKNAIFNCNPPAGSASMGTPLAAAVREQVCGTKKERPTN